MGSNLYYKSTISGFLPVMLNTPPLFLVRNPLSISCSLFSKLLFVIIRKPLQGPHNRNITCSRKKLSHSRLHPRTFSSNFITDVTATLSLIQKRERHRACVSCFGQIEYWHIYTRTSVPVEKPEKVECCISKGAWSHVIVDEKVPDESW